MTDKPDVQIDPRRMQIEVSPPLDYDLDLTLDPTELGLDAAYDEALPFEARPMFDMVGKLILGALTMVGIGLLVWSFWNWPVSP